MRLFVNLEISVSLKVQSLYVYTYTYIYTHVYIGAYMYIHICTLHTHTHPFRLFSSVLCTYFSELVRRRKDTRKIFQSRQISSFQCFTNKKPLLHLKASIPSLSFLTWDLVPHCLFCTIISVLISLSIMLSIKGHTTCYNPNLWGLKQLCWGM